MLRYFDMNYVDEIKKPIIAEFQQFTQLFAEELPSENQLLLDVYDFVRKTSGKQMRPILTLLSAKLCGEINRGTIQCAKAVELLHTASLVHDDIVDDTLERRGNPSVNARWSNKIAVFAGDYLFSKSLNCAISTADLRILKSIADIGNELTDGELLQLVTTQLSKTTEEHYYQIIQKKTAQLFASCCEVGALSSNASDDAISHLKNYGMYLGISFQIKDDIFDYFDDIQIGKPTGNDIRDGKVTLPLIYALASVDSTEKNDIVQWIDNRDYSGNHIQEITRFTIKNGGIEYAIQQMEAYKIKAIEELNGFENSEIKQSLILCAEYTALRNF